MLINDCEGTSSIVKHGIVLSMFLEIFPPVTKEEVESAHRKGAKKYHPDMNPGDPQANETMAKLNEAKDTLVSLLD